MEEGYTLFFPKKNVSKPARLNKKWEQVTRVDTANTNLIRYHGVQIEGIHIYMVYSIYFGAHGQRPNKKANAVLPRECLRAAGKKK